jgi:hypothetical protein
MRGSSYARSNIDAVKGLAKKTENIKLSNQQARTFQTLSNTLDQNKLQPMFAYIDGLASDKSLVDSVSPDRYVGWNFTPSYGTIEFRLSPGIIDVQSAYHWIAVATGFVFSALTRSLTCEKTLLPEANCARRLRKFIRGGAQSLDIEQHLQF